MNKTAVLITSLINLNFQIADRLLEQLVSIRNQLHEVVPKDRGFVKEQVEKKKKVESKERSNFAQLPKAKSRKQAATGRVGIGAERQRKAAAGKAIEQEARKDVS